MLRSLFQVYITGSDKALPFYQKAFDAEVLCSYPNADGTFMHAELDICGQILAIAEANFDMAATAGESKYKVSFASCAERNPGNTMQLCLHFGECSRDKIDKAYEVLWEDAFILNPLGPVSYSPYMFSLIDKYGVNWCIFE